MTPEMTNAVVGLAIQETPAVIEAFKALFKKQNPDLPEPTDAEVITGYQSAFVSSLAKDDAWDAAHPPV